jgi:hypothetical protein
VLWLELDKIKTYKTCCVLSLKYRAQKKNTVFQLKFELGARQKWEGEWVKNEGGAFHPEDIAGDAF